MSINIGNNNKISHSSIVENNGDSSSEKKYKNFAERHPVAISIIISFAVGFVLLFSFWQNIVNFIESLF